MIKRVLVTGANGFVGRFLCERLLSDGFIVRAAVREKYKVSCLPEGVEVVSVGSINSNTQWSKALSQVDAVVHLAARVHIMRERAQDPLREFRQINVDGTRVLAENAVLSGVKRFVFISSIKVNGEQTTQKPFDEDDRPQPQDAYGVSKYEAEVMLKKMMCSASMELVVLRPTLVYGPGVKGNFRKLMWLIKYGVPLPFCLLNNRRSLIGVQNFVDIIARCIVLSNAAGQTFLVSDGEDLSTPGLIRQLSNQMNIPARLVSVPLWVLKCGSCLIGKKEMMQRLTGSLQVNSNKVRQLLNWHPVMPLDQGLKIVAQWFLRQSGERIT